VRVSILALIIRHAMRVRRIAFSPVACPAVPYIFHTISRTARFSKTVTEHKMYV